MSTFQVVSTLLLVASAAIMKTRSWVRGPVLPALPVVLALIAAAAVARGGDATAQPAWAAAADAAAARGKRVVDAAKQADETNGESAGDRTDITAYVMVDLPPLDPAAKDQRRIAIEFRGISVEALAKFYTEVCPTQRPSLDPKCLSRRVTISTSQNVPPAQACRVVEGALRAACAPES